MNKTIVSVLIPVAAVAVLYLMVRKDLKAGQAAATSLVTGEVGPPDPVVNPYYGQGVLGTVGYAFNRASGGLFQRIGSAIGGGLADLAGN